MMYEKMKKKIEDVVERGEVGNDVVQQLEALKQWTDEFNPGNHPPVIQVNFNYFSIKSVIII